MRKTLKNGNTSILQVHPYLAIYSKIMFPEVKFQYILWIIAEFHNWLQNSAWGAGQRAEWINSVGWISEFGCNSIVCGCLFLPGLQHIPARFYAGSGQTHWPRCRAECRCMYLDGSSKECGMSCCPNMHVCTDACARALCDKGQREVHLLSLISLESFLFLISLIGFTIAAVCALWLTPRARSLVASWLVGCCSRG